MHFLLGCEEENALSPAEGAAGCVWSVIAWGLKGLWLLGKALAGSEGV